MTGFPPPFESPNVAVIAPASAIEPHEIHSALDYLRSLGFAPRESKRLYTRERFLAGPDPVRRQDLEEAFTDPDISAIFSARGGYGSLRLLDTLDYARLKEHPKPFFGFSDTTALQLALLKHTGLKSYTGLTLCSDISKARPEPRLESSLLQILKGQSQSFENIAFSGKNGAEGPLIGGCLSLLSRLLGTPHLPDPAGAVLLLEDVGEEPYKIDRMLTHLHLAGIFSKISALILGGFSRCLPNDPADGTVEDVLNEHMQRLDLPVLRGFPYSHTGPRCILPLGARVTITPIGENTATVRIPS